MRTANDEAPRETPETRAIEDRIHEAQAEAEAGQARAKELEAEAKTARFEGQQALQQEIELVQAEVQLAQDEAADAKEDLIRSGGDARSRLQQFLQQHDAAEHENGKARVDAAANARPPAPASTLLAQWGAWSAARAKQNSLIAAQKGALAVAHDS